ncbi:nitroreductase/quinone reductase family protein [Paractinoplanes atraurantiacus]|uniref:Deazaflavin-dependent oxidoreductase, nitroreductase family n=1 Tax=Paractinoplanes atraurantiacus TaxID=1036182 RepID=A0A285IKU6_9ACTN|nr:nitroreductase/quinone reductase family protein [Actinoplanes atraurantiacus]SNY48582.1 deazaflavin-dependent oxidoreductase, nitroreductase family [Actinoplanes atraurantiacus]
MPNPYNQQIIDEFRAGRGHRELILLTTRGARSGRPHTTPLGFRPYASGIVVIASAAGAPKNPDWFHNVLADPRVTVDDGTRTYEAVATPLAGAERDRAFAEAAADDPGWADYQARTTRIIPVVALNPA